jgi:membrane associated rhomboid family serine protease
MTPWVTRLLVANVVVFLLTMPYTPGLWQQFGWVPALGLVRPWTILTYQFLHAHFMHLLFNMIGLFFFGPRLEARIGSRHFLGLYLVSGSIGAVLSVGSAVPGWTNPWVPVIGASGAVFGVLLGFARYWPDERIFIWGVLPVKARVLVIGLALISVWAGLGGAGGSVAHFAHLGGFLGGWIYLKFLERSSPAEKFKRQVEAAQGIGAVPTGRELERWRRVDPSAMHPLNREEFERILGKAESNGIRSLSPQERAFMQRVSDT